MGRDNPTDKPGDFRALMPAPRSLQEQIRILSHLGFGQFDKQIPDKTKNW